LEEVVNQYNRLLNEYGSQKSRLESRIKLVSIVRLIVFFLILFVIYQVLVKELPYLWGGIAIAIIAFLILIKYHAKLFRKKTFFENLLQINKEEINALKGDISVFGKGEEYEISGHDFSLDLDVFGKESLFQLTDRTCTVKGSTKLGSWFNNPLLNKKDIIERQEAVKELSALITFRQHFNARGRSVKENVGEIDFLEKWNEKENIFFPKLSIKILYIAFSVLNIVGSFLFAFDLLPGRILITFLIVSLGVVGIFTKRINPIHSNLSKRTALLEKYIYLIELIENADFKSTLLKQIKSKIETNGDSASKNIKHLSKILSALDTRLNIFAGVILNALVLWDIQQVWRVEKWKTLHANNLKQWFDAIAEIDALNSVANLSFNNPNWSFPELNSENKWDFELIRHPLMNTEGCVPNNFLVKQMPHLKVITGANMAGKSTYLRTIGSNLILAMVGAPVHAKRMNFMPIQLVSSLRTTDSLMKNESYFYAEIKRLQYIVERLRKGEQLFVLLDEILKGTNSKDKEQGSRALLRQLINLKTVGIIATHDLSLGKLEEEYYPMIQNQCFEVDIKNDELSFDYIIRPGVAKNMNASFLLQKMGIV
jgi:DNA mismatch repair ATPase MutS